MRQVTITELRKLGSKVRDCLPCALMCDGVVIAVLAFPCDVTLADNPSVALQYDVTLPSKATTKCHRLTDLPLSKQRQANSTW